MAITLKDDDKNKMVQPTQTNSGPVGPHPAQQQGSGYTNIQRIAQANQGNRLGQAVGGSVYAAGDEAQKSIKKSKDDFNQGVVSSNPYLNNTKETQENIKSVIADPTAKADAEVGNFEAYRSAQYKGPTGLQDYSGLQQQAQSAQQLGQNIGTTGGRIALLQRFAAKPTQSYNTGMSRLDSALLAQGPKQDLQNAARATRGLTGELNTANQAAGAQANEYQARAKALADYTNMQIQGAENPDLEKLSAAATNATAERDRIAAAIKSGTASAEDLRAVGLGNLVGKSTLGLDVSRFINVNGPKEASRLGVADAAQTARLQALAKLGGQTDLGNEFKDASQAGSFNKDRFTGADQALAAYGQKEAEYKANNDALNSTINSMPENTKWAVSNNLLSPDLVQAYIKGDPAMQQRIREEWLGDQTINDKMDISNPGEVRDRITAELNSLAAQYAGYQNAIASYGNGTFGNAQGNVPVSALPDSTTT